MKKLGLQVIAMIVVLVAVQACGETEAERQAKEQARLDSLRQAAQAEVAAQIAQARQDSIDAANAAAALAQQQEEEGITPSPVEGVSFVEDGTFSLQVGAWRSEEKANAFVATWNERGYDNGYVVKIGDETTGDVWFRVRIGFLGSREDGEALGRQLGDEYGTPFWVSEVQRGN